MPFLKKNLTFSPAFAIVNAGKGGVVTVKIRNMVLCGLFAALITLCAWLSIPLGDVAITLQTFAVFLCLSVLGGKLGTLTVLVYLLLGAVGIPVFSGFVLRFLSVRAAFCRLPCFCCDSMRTSVVSIRYSR